MNCFIVWTVWLVFILMGVNGVAYADTIAIGDGVLNVVGDGGVNTMVIQSGSTYNDGNSWKRTVQECESTDVSTIGMERTHFPTHMELNGAITIHGRKRDGNGRVFSIALQRVSRHLRGDDRSRVHRGRRERAECVVPGTGEVDAMIPYPEGCVVSVEFTDSTKLSEYNGVFSWRLTYSKNVIIRNKNGFDTPDGPVGFTNAIAYNDRGDSLFADSAGMGKDAMGKSIYSEWFPVGGFECLASNGAVVTVDPTLTLQPSSTNDGDCNMFGAAPYTTYNYGVVASFAAWGGSGGSVQGKGLIRFSQIPSYPMKIISASITMYCTYNGMFNETVDVYLLTGREARYTVGTGDGSATAATGESCWNQWGYNTDNWVNGAGLAGVRSKISTLVTTNTLYASMTWIIPPQWVGRGFAYLFRTRQDIYTISYRGLYAGSCNYTTAQYRPKLTILYTNAPAVADNMNGGFDQ